MGHLPELRISGVRAGSAGQRQVELTWTDSQAPRQATVITVAGPSAGDQDAELIRWYLEKYAEYPADPAPDRAKRAEAALAAAGVGLFKRVFASQDAAMIWALARDRLAEARVEIDSDLGEAAGLDWELLRDPDSNSPVAVSAAEFVRTHLRAAGHRGVPGAVGDVLRVLLVVARPGGSADVPFRSVASRLVRGGAGAMDGLDLDVLRPATYARLSEVLRAAHAAGRPYHVVHFDGHGDWLDLADLDSAGSGGNSDRHVRAQFPGLGSRPGPCRPTRLPAVRRPAGRSEPAASRWPTLGELLADTEVPVLVLNACRSAYAEPSSPATQNAARAYATTIGEFGSYYFTEAEEGRTAQVLRALQAEEANLWHALELARAAGLWDAVTGCLQGLKVLHERTGRDGEWARLVHAVTPDFTDPVTGRPLPGREDQWNMITGYRVRLAMAAPDWPAAASLLDVPEILRLYPEILRPIGRWHASRAGDVARAGKCGGRCPIRPTFTCDGLGTW